MENIKPLVVVLSRNYATGLSVIRSLGASGFTVDLVASAYKKGTSLIASQSKYVRNSVEVVSKKVKDGDDTELLDELLKYRSEKEKPVLFPTDDYTASVMDLNREQLSEIFLMPKIVGGKNGSMVECMNKTVQGKLAKEAGIKTPKEWIISLENEIEIPTDMIYPCFVKPIESISGYKKEMKACEDEETLLKHLSSLKRKFANRSILIQEFLNIESEIDFSGVCFDDEVIIPAIIKKTNVAQYEKGVTLSGILVPFEELDEKLRNSIIKMLKSFHYYGMFDFELSIVGDEIYFNEVNLRSGGPNFAYFMSGVNLPALFAKNILNIEYDDKDKKVDSFGKSFIYEKIAWEDYINGFMTKKELNACINNSDITLLCNDDDPVPGIIFKKKIKKTATRRKIKKIKKTVIKKSKKLLYPVLRPVKHILLRYPQMYKKNARNPLSEQPRVLVSGRNYCSNLCMARSLGMAGYEVEILRIFQVKPKRSNLLKQLKPDAYSKYIKGYYTCISRRRSKRIVKRLIKLADPDRKMLLIPADDLVAHIIDANYDILSEFYVMPNVKDMPNEIGNLMNKDVQKQLAINAGLPVLKSCVIKTDKGEFEIPDGVTYPCFIKPNISRNSSKSRMKKCDSREELYNTIKEFSRKKDIEMLVEDYVEIGKEYSILGVSTKQGVNAPGFFVAEEGGQAEHRGVAVVGKLLPCEQEKALINDVVKFIESLEFDGLYDVDLIETVDGKMYFVELNMRFGASGYAVTKAGINLPGMFADYMLKNKPIDTGCQLEETGQTFVSEKVLIEEYVKSRISFKNLKYYMNSADIHFIYDSDDKSAYRHFRRFYLVAVIMKPLIKIKEQKKAKKAEKSIDVNA